MSTRKNLDIKLLKLVKENPILYNPKYPKYLDFDSREVVWQKIGDTLNRPATKFAGIQCQIQFGDFQEDKHKPGFIENLEEYLPQNYCGSWGIEKKIYREFRQFPGLSPLEAKDTYIQTARDLPTFGVTFFLVKEKHKGKKKLVPRLLGINKSAILRLDQDTKEILQEWPLTHVKTYYAGKSESFTLNFGDYSDKEYSVKTQDAHRIREILEAYIDLIRKTIFGKPGAEPGETSYICDGIVQPGKAHSIQHVVHNQSKMVTETMVGPNKIEPFQQGSAAQQGTQIVTMQQIVLSNNANQAQQAVKGEVALRGDMSINCARKLNRMNSDSVKIVTLLTEPDNQKVAKAQKVVEEMQAILPVVVEGVRQTAEKQTVPESKKMLLDELDELVRFMTQLAEHTTPGQVNTEAAKEAAEKMADLTTQMYFSLNQDVRRRSNLLNRSRKSFMEGEKTDQLIRKGSFIAAANRAGAAVDSAATTLNQSYSGAPLDENEQSRLERSLEERMGKLNAALALYLMAHSDPNNVDYEMAIKSMSTIDELMPQLAKDAQVYASCKDPEYRSKVLGEVQALLDSAKKICNIAKTSDKREELQEAANNYSDVAGRLIFTFSKGTNGDKEYEVTELARDACYKTSLVLQNVHALAERSRDAQSERADAAGGRASDAAGDLLACAQLTAPAIREPHCRSALTAAVEALQSSLQHVQHCCKPLLDQPGTDTLGQDIHAGTADVYKALERLKDAYGNINNLETAEDSLPQQEVKRLKFIYSIAGAKDKLKGLEDHLGQCGDKPTGAEQELARGRLQQQLARLNAAVAALTAATADESAVDYETAEHAARAIADILPHIVKDADILSYDNDANTNMLELVRSVCDASRQLCDAAEEQKGVCDAAASFAAASNNLSTFIAPSGDKSKEAEIKNLSAAICASTSEFLSPVQQLTQAVDVDTAGELDQLGAKVADDAQALLAVAQLSAPNITEPDASKALILSAERLRGSGSGLLDSCRPQLDVDSGMKQELLHGHRQLEDSINALIAACPVPDVESSEERKRLRFIVSAASAKRGLNDVLQNLEQPVACQLMAEEDGVRVQRELCSRLAELQAAVHALENSTADGKTPDYAEADRAVKYIKEMLPQVVRDARALCGNTTPDQQQTFLQQIRELCDASHSICDAADTQGLHEAAKKFGATSKKLTFLISPPPNKAKDKEITALASSSTQEASSLATDLQDLAKSTDGDTREQLMMRSKKIADAANKLHAVVQDPDRSHELLSAIAQLRDVSRLPDSCQQLSTAQQQKLQQSQQQLEDSLDRLLLACNDGQKVGATEERKRLKFIMSATAAKNNVTAAQRVLEKPLPHQTMSQAEEAKLQHSLQEKVAQLSAEVATVETTSDGVTQDYGKALRAVENIQELIPTVIQDARSLGSSKPETERAKLLQQVNQLCDTCSRICDSIDDQQALQNAAAEYGKVSKKLTFIVSPATNEPRTTQIKTSALAAVLDGTVLAEEMLEAANKTPDAAAADALVRRSAAIRDAANRLEAVTEVTVDPAASEQWRRALKQLQKESYLPKECSQLPKEQLHSLQNKLQQLTDNLDKATSVTQTDGGRPALFPDDKRHKLQETATWAKNNVQRAKEQLTQPLAHKVMSQAEEAKLQNSLNEKLAQLSAEVATVETTSDGVTQDHGKALRAVENIQELIPTVIQDARSLSSSKPETERAKLLQQVNQLCDTCSRICDSIDDQQALQNAAAEYGKVSKKLTFIVSPATNEPRTTQIKTSALTAVHDGTVLAEEMLEAANKTPDAAAADALARRSAAIRDAANRLEAVTEITVDPAASEQWRRAVKQLHKESYLPKECSRLPKEQLHSLQSKLQQLTDNLDKVGSETEPNGGRPAIIPDDNREKLHKTATWTKNNVQRAREQLTQQAPCQLMREEEGLELQHQLCSRVALMNAAVASIDSHMGDTSRNYPEVEKSINYVGEMMPMVVKDGQVLCGAQTGAARAQLLQQLKELCDATDKLCDHVTSATGIKEATTKFGNAAKKLVFFTSPAHDQNKEIQVTRLSSAACNQATSLASELKQVAQDTDSPAAKDLMLQGEQVTHAANRLRAVSQVLAPVLKDSACSDELLTAVRELRNVSALPTSQQLSVTQQQQLSDRQLQLLDHLNRIMLVCSEVDDAVDPKHLLPSEEDKRLDKLVDHVVSVSSMLDSAETELKQPIQPSKMKSEEVKKLQLELKNRQSRLEAALTALAVALANQKNINYAAADEAIAEIAATMPLVIQDARRLAGAGKASKSVLSNAHAHCARARELVLRLHEDMKEDSTYDQKPTSQSKSSESLPGSNRGPLTPDIMSELTNKLNSPTPPSARSPAPRPPPPSQPTKPLVTLKPVVIKSTPSTPESPINKPQFPKLKPAPPLRGEKTVLTSPTAKSVAMDFLCTLREESEASNREAEKQKLMDKFSDTADECKRQLARARDQLHSTSPSKVEGPAAAAELVSRERQLEQSLSAAAVQAAAIVAANYANKLDYEAATTPTVELTRAVKKIASDGAVVSSCLGEEARQKFLKDLLGVCDAANHICEAAKTDQKQLNAAAISFGDQSTKVLRVVGADVNPQLEKEMIARAKAIGDSASRLAHEAANVVPSSALDSAVPSSAHDSAVPSSAQDICTVGTSCVDAAGKLVYTAKLTAPTIGHSTSQNALLSSADQLSSSLQTFNSTLEPLTVNPQNKVTPLKKEAEQLQKLLETLTADVRGGKFGKREVEREIVIDTPLRRSTLQIIENAENMSKLSALSPELRSKYLQYRNRLQAALFQVDLANARYQRAPNDKAKRAEMEMSVQELQMTLLQTRPSRSGQERSDIVDFRDFLQDLTKESEELQATARKYRGTFCTADSGADDPITILCSKITEDANKAVQPAHHTMTCEEDVSDLQQFGQDCDAMIKEINATIQGISDEKAKQALLSKALPLYESCQLLRFAANCHISATKSAAFDEVLHDLDNFEDAVVAPLLNNMQQKRKKERNVVSLQPAPAASASAVWARLALSRALRDVTAGAPSAAPRALALYAAAKCAECHEGPEPILDHMRELIGSVCSSVGANSHRVVHWDREPGKETLAADTHTTLFKTTSSMKPGIQVLNDEDLDKLLNCQSYPVEGSRMQLEDKLHQLSSKLSSLTGTIVLSVKKPESLARSLHATAQSASQLANIARALKDDKKPNQSNRIESAVNDMCISTYYLLKTSESVCQAPTHPHARRTLMDACRQLNETLDKLERSVQPDPKYQVQQHCTKLQRTLQLQRAAGTAAHAHGSATGYAHVVGTLQEQGEVLNKLNHEQSMSREEFLQSLHYIATAIENSANCASHADYLLSLHESHPEVGKEGLVDVPRIQKAAGAVQETCVNIIMDLKTDQYDSEIPEKRKVLKRDIDNLLKELEEAMPKIKDGNLKSMFQETRQEVDASAKKVFVAVQERKPKEQVMSSLAELLHDVSEVRSLAEQPALAPLGPEGTDHSCDELVKAQTDLISSGQELLKEVKSSPDRDVMTWVMYNKRKNVLDSFEALMKAIKSHGQRVNFIEAPLEETVDENKTYVQTQMAIAFKWLQKPMSKAEVKSNGQEAVRNIIATGRTMMEDLRDDEKESMRHLVTETEQLLKECSQKIDHEKYSVLMDRTRELQKAITRGLVGRVVEDFMETDTPLADLDIIAEAETDENKRKLILKQKIADLLAQLNRITRTAQLIADSGSGGRKLSTELKSCSQQTELLAPMLVKAAEERIHTPDNRAVIEKYQALIEQYAQSVARVRDLCDQSVDPMDFVQTASETMERMRDVSTKENDPIKGHHTYAAINKLAGRVVLVGLSSREARRDAELQRVLTDAQRKLQAAPSRRSKLPDWNTDLGLQTTDVVESLLDGGFMFAKPLHTDEHDQTGLADIYRGARSLHASIRDWSSRDNDIVAVAKRMAVLMAQLSDYMHNDKQRDVLLTSKSIVSEAHEVARLANKLARECSDVRIKNNLIQACERIPTISGQLKMLTTVKGSSLGHHGIKEDKEAMDMLVGNAQSLMSSISDVIKAAASASVKIQSQYGPRIKWVRKTRDSDKMFLYNM